MTSNGIPPGGTGPMQVGARFGDGRFEINKALWWCAGAGRYRGLDRQMRRYVVITVLPRSRSVEGVDLSSAAFRLDVAGVAPLIYTTTLNDGRATSIVTVEAQPVGAPLTAWGIGTQATSDVIALGAALFAVLATAHAAGHVLASVHSELIYRAGFECSPVPRGASLLRNAAMTTHIEYPFSHVCDAPELLAGLPPSPAADVFSAALVMAWLADWKRAGSPPIPGDTTQQVTHLVRGQPVAIISELESVVGPALVPGAAARPSAAEMATRLRAISPPTTA